jgi:glycosyltransferase involved in cell wall biosynthesis
MPKLQAAATPNVTLLGYQTFSELKRHMQQAKAFVFAAEEDFGITPVESQACGTPVIAFGKGGALETVVDSVDESVATGVFFAEQTIDSLVEAVGRFESRVGGFSPHACRRQAEHFSIERFRSEFSTYVGNKMEIFRSSLS